VSKASLECVAKYFFKAYLNEKLKFTNVLFLKEIQFSQNSFFGLLKYVAKILSSKSVLPSE
jgi:hypothetical protein